MGAAIKMDELVLMTMPNSMGKAKLDTALPPAIAIGKMAINVLVEVNTVRVNVALMLRLTSCAKSWSGLARKFSRIRSKTTT